MSSPAISFLGRRARGVALGAGLLALHASCIATTAKLRVGPTVDTDGGAAVQADLSFGFGYASSEEAGVTGSLGVGTGTRNTLELTDTIEYHRLEDDYGWRTGVRVDAGLAGEKTVGGWVHGALLLPLRKRHSSGGHEKSFQSSADTRWSLGLEGRFGYLSTEGPEGEDGRAAAAMGMAASLEWHGLSRMW